jgi:hypothetical protein
MEQTTSDSLSSDDSQVRYLLRFGLHASSFISTCDVAVCHCRFARCAFLMHVSREVVASVRLLPNRILQMPSSVGLHSESQVTRHRFHLNVQHVRRCTASLYQSFTGFCSECIIQDAMPLGVEEASPTADKDCGLSPCPELQPCIRGLHYECDIERIWLVGSDSDSRMISPTPDGFAAHSLQWSSPAWDENCETSSSPLRLQFSQPTDRKADASRTRTYSTYDHRLIYSNKKRR